MVLFCKLRQFLLPLYATGIRFLLIPGVLVWSLEMLLMMFVFALVVLRDYLLF